MTVTKRKDCPHVIYGRINSVVGDSVITTCSACGEILYVKEIDPKPRAAATTAADSLRAAADLFDERQAVYGNNHDRLATAMIGMFPEGIHLTSPQDHKRFAIIVLMVVKLTRYAVNWDRGGHSDSLKDLSVYAAMLDKIDEAG